MTTFVVYSDIYRVAQSEFVRQRLFLLNRPKSAGSLWATGICGVVRCMLLLTYYRN